MGWGKKGRNEGWVRGGRGEGGGVAVPLVALVIA